MIELPRGVARAFRAVLRKSAQSRRPLPQPALAVRCRAGPSGLEAACEGAGVLLRWSAAGKRAPGRAAFPAALLDALSGKDAGPVRLEQEEGGKGKASWNEGGAERVLEYDVPAGTGMPEGPSCPMADPGTGFQEALADAALAAARDPSRYALGGVLLRAGKGGTGRVAATDGRQLLLQEGFSFPWEGDALVPALPVFACPELAGPAFLVGRKEGRVAMATGPWLLCLEEMDSRHYPDFASALAGTRPSRLALSEEDAARLARALPGLPGKDEASRPVSLEFYAPPRVRAGDEEIALPGSRVSGLVLSLSTDRRFLLRALALGFKEIEAGKGRPLLCRDARRTYLWMPLDGLPAKAEPSRGSEERRSATMAHPNGHAPPDGAAAPPGDALAEAEALRVQLQEALARTARLVAELKRQKREQRAVKDAVASLRRLGGLGG